MHIVTCQACPDLPSCYIANLLTIAEHCTSINAQMNINIDQNPDIDIYNFLPHTISSLRNRIVLEPKVGYVGIDWH